MGQVWFNYLYHYEHEVSRYIPPHSHNIYEMVLYDEGTGTSHTDCSDFSFSKGRCILYAPGVRHDETHESFTRVDCIGFYLEDKILPTRDFTDKAETELLFELRNRLRNELVCHKPGYNDMANYIVGETVVAILRMTGLAATAANDRQTAASVEYATKFIDENFHSEVEIKKLAVIQGYSYEHFRHLFKAQCGVSPKQYLLEKRISYATHLLATTEITVGEVAERSGFKNPSMFSFIFKKHIGVAPIDYRRSVKHD